MVPSPSDRYSGEFLNRYYMYKSARFGLYDDFKITATLVAVAVVNRFNALEIIASRQR